MVDRLDHTQEVAGSSPASPTNSRVLEMTTKQEWIEKRAYYLWQGAGRPSGMELTFWCAAENDYNKTHICCVTCPTCGKQDVMPTNGGKHIGICRDPEAQCGYMCSSLLS